MSDETFRWVITAAVAISTLCIFIMAAVTFALYMTVTKVQAKIVQVADQVDPLIGMVRQLVVVNGPKVSVMATNAQALVINAKDISDVAKDQAHRFAEVGRDIADRTKAQVSRADAVLDETVHNAQVTGAQVREAVLKPVREASGVLAGIRAAVGTYRSGRRPSIDNVTQDEEMFI